jgi:arabinosaccharide transport system substrate-binding protein
MKLRKFLGGFLSTALMISMLASCGGGSSAGEEVGMETGAGEDASQMSMWTFVELHGQFYEDMLQRWNEENPDKQINVKLNVMPYDDMHNKLTLALQSGEGAPDMVDIEIGKFPSYLQGEVQFMDLTSYVDPYRDDIVSSRLDIYSKDGKNYGIPTHVGATVAFYNTEILEEAGVDYTTIKTWDDYKAAGEKVKAIGKIMGCAETNNAAIYDTMLAAQGSDKTDEDGNPTLDTPESIKALTTIQELVQAGIDQTIPGGHPDTEEGYGALNQGDYACVIRPLWMTSRYINYMDNLNQKIAMAPYPVFDEETFGQSYGGGGTGTVVTLEAAEPELAAEWLCWAKLGEVGNEQIWNVLGFDPCNMALWEDEELTHNPDNPINAYFLTNAFDVLNQVKNDFVTIKSTSGVPTVNNILCTVTLNDVIENGVDPAEAAKAAQEQAENELGLS